jgi:phosphatidylglycerophosphate synthase
LRSPKEQLLTPVAARLLRSIHPTTITIVAFGVGVVAAVAAWQQAYVVALALWALNRVLDGLDGTVARMHGKQSDLGGYLDIVLDITVYALIPLALAFGINSADVYMSLAFLLGTFYVNGASWMYLAALLEKRRHGAAMQGELTTVTMPGGLIEGTETIIFYTLFLLLPVYLPALFTIMGVLVIFTAGQRLVWASRHL